MNTKNLILTFLIGLFSTTEIYCQIGEYSYDSRIKRQLDDLGLKYSITDRGDFKLLFDMGNRRTQMVVVNSNTYQYGGMEIRELLSIAAVTDTKSAFNQYNLFTLLEKNDTYKLGAWQIDGGTSPYVLEFALRISANSAQSVLTDLVHLAATVADEMEEILTEEDKH